MTRKKKVNYLHQSLVYILNSDEKEKMTYAKMINIHE